ncbi:LysR family transcriptional regulator [Paraburkholderia saeva]|uniref:LysR family transcriptional regulator n=1 Tax=Paraburkholderia saeva TaxID=2777537 RepID=UPI001DC22F6B|nr:LysR family transcriptional regulator [Paraburkholderia saeva]CAG4914347.1 HTH-type transcriptional regulator DmlR [Paraburkholderia saeva]
MQLDDLRIFAATVDARNFTAAARKLSLSKQFVSRRVMALEAELGVRLLVRNTRKLAITDLGRELYERARRILTEVEDAAQAMSSQHTEPRGLLRISAPMSFGMTHLSPLVTQFLKRNEAVRFEVVLSDRSVDVIGEGFDMAIRIGMLADSTLIAQKIADLRVVACCSPGYRRRRGEPASPLDLEAHDCLLYGHERPVLWEFVIGNARKSIEVDGRLHVNNGELVRDAAVAGLGIALLPEFIVAEALRTGTLVTVLETFERPPFGLYAVYPQHRQRSSTIRAFTSFLREALAEKGGV